MAAGRQPLAQNFRRENVRDSFDLIAGAGMALHADAQGAQFFDPAPHRVERVTPISRAIFAPLMTIMALSESSASSASMRRSVVPADVVEAFGIHRRWRDYFRLVRAASSSPASLPASCERDRRSKLDTWADFNGKSNLRLFC